MNEALLKTRKWLENIVIGLGLCPFAGRAYMDKQVGFEVVAYSPAILTNALNKGIKEVLNPQNAISTKLIILSDGLEDFHDYLDIYDGIEQELKQSGLAEEIQLANFHPEYQFNDVDKDDIQNFTNRSPYPVFHILKVEEVTAAIEGHHNIDEIPEKNIATMRKLGLAAIMDLYA